MLTTRNLRFLFFTLLALIFYNLISSGNQASSSIPRLSLFSKSNLLWKPVAPKYAIATFLSTRVENEYDEDLYFTATRVLAYQLLHNPETRTTQDTPFLVLVMPHVSERKRRILQEEGAIVIAIDPFNPSSWIPQPPTVRWLDQFSKLQVFGLTQYDRVLYIDSDMLVTRPLDDIWNEAIVCNSQPTLYQRFNTKQEYVNARALPKNYVLAGVIDYAGPGQDTPILLGSYPRLNGGFFVLKPDEDLLAYYRSILNHDKALFDEGLMEQSLLNYAHREDGPMPWSHLPPRRYSANWPQMADLEAGSATLHDKFWNPGEWISRELVDRWWRTQGRMEGYWQWQRESKLSQNV